MSILSRTRKIELRILAAEVAFAVVDLSDGACSSTLRQGWHTGWQLHQVPQPVQPGTICMFTSSPSSEQGRDTAAAFCSSIRAEDASAELTSQ